MRLVLWAYIFEQLQSRLCKIIRRAMSLSLDVPIQLCKEDLAPPSTQMSHLIFQPWASQPYSAEKESPILGVSDESAQSESNDKGHMRHRQMSQSSGQWDGMVRPALISSPLWLMTTWTRACVTRKISFWYWKHVRSTVSIELKIHFMAMTMTLTMTMTITETMTMRVSPWQWPFLIRNTPDLMFLESLYLLPWPPYPSAVPVAWLCPAKHTHYSAPELPIHFAPKYTTRHHTPFAKIKRRQNSRTPNMRRSTASFPAQ